MLDILSLIRLTIRRWAVVVPVLAVALLGMVLLVANRSADHTLSGSYLLVGGSVETRVDPEIGTDVLEGLLLEQSLREDLESKGLSGEYSVAVGSSGTTLRLTVDGATPEAVVATTDELVRLTPELLDSAFGPGRAATVLAQPLTRPRAEDVSATGDVFSYTTSIVLSPANVSTGNPFPATMATISPLLTAAASFEFANDVEQAVPGVEFEVVSPTRESPLIGITVVGTSGRMTHDGYEFVRDSVQAELQRLQDEFDVRSSDRTLLKPILEPSVVEVTPASMVRPVAAMVVLGGGLAVGAAVLAESASLGRRHGAPLVGGAFGRRLRAIALGSLRRLHTNVEGLVRRWRTQPSTDATAESPPPPSTDRNNSARRDTTPTGTEPIDDDGPVETGETNLARTDRISGSEAGTPKKRSAASRRTSTRTRQ